MAPLRLLGWCDTYPSLLVSVISFLDVKSLCSWDTAVRSSSTQGTSAYLLYKNAFLPAVSAYKFAVDDLTIEGMGAALKWAVRREIDLAGFVFTVKEYKSSIFAAVDKGMYDLAELMLSKGSLAKAGGMLGVNEGEYSRTAPLHQAVYRQRVDLVSLLLNHGADPDARDNSHYTALQGACSEAHHPGKAYKLAKALISHGSCDLNVLDAAGQTPLIWESAKGRTNMVELLVGTGTATGTVDLDAVDEIGSCALYYACKSNNIQVVKLLLEANAKVDNLNANRRTPLHTAARKGHTDIAKLLVQHGASLEAEDAEGKTPYSYATRGGPKWAFLEPAPPPPPPSEFSP